MTSLPLTDSLTVVAKYWFDKFTALQADLGLQGVFYGDQQTPKTPALCVEPGEKTRIWAGAPAQTENAMRVFFFLYHDRLQSIQLNRLEADQFAEQVELVLHQDLQAGGLVTAGYCSSLESGYAARGGDLLKATRITWDGMNKTHVTGTNPS